MRKVTIHPYGDGQFSARSEDNVTGRGNSNMMALIGWLAQNGVVVEIIDHDPRNLMVKG